MRIPLLRRAVVLGFCLGLTTGPVAAAADIDLTATWKLVALAQLRDNDLFPIQIQAQGDKLAVSFAHPEEFAAPPKVVDARVNNGGVSLALRIGEVALTFRGKPSDASTIKGVLTIDGNLTPARLEKAKAHDGAFDPSVPQPGQIARDFMSARNEQLPRTRVRLIRALIAQKPNDPSMAPAYLDVIRNAEAAELAEAEVRKVVTQWVDVARPYGDEYVHDVEAQAVKALVGKAIYASLSLQLAREVDAALAGSGSLEARASIAAALAEAATLAGDKALAASARTRSDRLESELDEAYHKAVPPFKPDTSAKTAARASDRVVLLELFTGAECPPCVAADVAFDALNQSYTPRQLVTLQYHLHIPGPDPLANPDTTLRSEYYPDLQGTPSVVIDGKAADVPGGRMSDSKDRYEEFRKLVNQALASPSRATIALKVDRQGDNLSIRATAQAKGQGASRLKLRLVLVEDSVRYVGGNGMRFHHHVVRALPGGVDGRPLNEGKGTNEVTVNLARLRDTLGDYLTEYAKEGNSFSNTPPPITSGALSVVAYVQDDDNKSVLNAVMTPVDAAR